MNTLFSLSNSPEDRWHALRLKYEWSRGRFFQRLELDRATPEVMDALWADGWRHFGEHFFRDLYNIEERKLVRVIPLRVKLSEHNLARDQRRLIKRNDDLDVRYVPIQLEDIHHELFARHAARFERNRPSDLYCFLSMHPQLVPCPTQMCEIWSQDRLLAVSFMDIGADATSSIYAMFDPDEPRRGLGHFTLLKEFEYAMSRGKSYVYTGYAHTKPTYYEYKKRFRGTEFYDGAGTWRPLDQLESVTFPQHRYETEEIPEELIVDPAETTDEGEP